MRKPAWFLILLGMFATVSIGAESKAQSLGALSAHHELRIERNVAGPDRIDYNVRVVDLDTGSVTMDSHIAAKPGEPVDSSSVWGDQQIRVRLSYTPNFFSATLNVLRGETILDELRTSWQLEPRVGGAANAPPRPVPPGAYRVGGNVKAPIVVTRVDPAYSEQARRDRISGVCILEVLIGKDGRVKDVAVLKPLPEGLSEAAIDAVRQWTFKPGTLDGEPVDVLFSLTVNFRLDVSKPPAPQP